MRHSRSTAGSPRRHAWRGAPSRAAPRELVGRVEVHTGTPKQSTWQAFFFNGRGRRGRWRRGRDDDLAPQELWYARRRLARKILGEPDHRRMPPCVRACARARRPRVRPRGRVLPRLGDDRDAERGRRDPSAHRRDQLWRRDRDRPARRRRARRSRRRPRAGRLQLRGHAVFELAAGARTCCETRRAVRAAQHRQHGTGRRRGRRGASRSRCALPAGGRVRGVPQPLRRAEQRSVSPARTRQSGAAAPHGAARARSVGDVVRVGDEVLARWRGGEAYDEMCVGRRARPARPLPRPRRRRDDFAKTASLRSASRPPD